MPTISVIIPVYNGEKTIRETIESVLNQTFTDFELIIINDGSQDSTLAIVESIIDPRLKVYSYKNAGLPQSRNRGIEKALGEYISFLDADDLWTPDKLESQWQALQDHPQASVAYSWTEWIDESGQPLGQGRYITANGDVYEKLLLNDFIGSGSNPLIQRQALLKVGNFDDTGSIYGVEDWDMWLRLAAHYQFVNVPERQILYRKSNVSMSANVARMEKSSLKVIEKALMNSPKSLQHLKKKCLGDRYKYLTFRSLEHPLERKRSFSAIRFLIKTIIFEPSILLRTKLMLIVLFKIAISILLPAQMCQFLLAKTKVSN